MHKRLNMNSGYTYFGARYYDSDISVWLSVDPLTDKYLSTSPYAYVENNPVMFVDPNGMYKDPADAKKSQEKATKQYGSKRVGKVYNANAGTDKEADYRYNVYKDGEDKYTHTNEQGGEYGYVPEVIVSDDEGYTLYEKSIKTDSDGKEYTQGSSGTKYFVRKMTDEEMAPMGGTAPIPGGSGKVIKGLKLAKLMKGKDVLKMLKKVGFKVVGKKGSHVQLKLFGKGPKVTVPVHGAKDLPKGTLKSIIKQVESAAKN